MANYFVHVFMCFVCAALSSLLISSGASIKELPTVSTKNVTAHYCPYPCTVGNETVCYRPPCPPPPCIDPVKDKVSDCCDYCPKGPDCRGPDGRPILWKHWKIVYGKNCTCKYFSSDATCV